MPYLHGIQVVENATSVPAPVENPAGVPVVFGTAPIGQLSATGATAATNKPILCNTFAEAKAAFGYSPNYSAFTICEAMDAFFKGFRVAPVIFVNVYDTSVAAGKETLNETLTVSNSQALLEADVIIPSMVVKDGNDTLTAGTDFTYEITDAGYVLFTLLTSHASISVTGNKTKSGTAKCAVTNSAVVGSYDASTGVSTGLETLRDIFPKYGVFPGLILAPGFTDSTVTLALAEKCEDISGMFKCDCVVDLPASTAPTVAALTTAKSIYTSAHMTAVYPKVKYDGKNMDYSAMYAASLCAQDAADGDGAPALRVSNNALPITAIVDASGNELHIDMALANAINALGIVTALNRSIWVSWGNNTCAYPNTTDPKDRWIGIRRFMSWWGNSFIVNYLDMVDDPANARLIESIVDSENIRGNSFVASGKCAGMRMEYNKEDNTVQNIIDGHFTFRMYLAPFTPAEYILNILEFDPAMLVEALGGEA